jgi:hypothetical protein
MIMYTDGSATPGEGNAGARVYSQIYSNKHGQQERMKTTMMEKARQSVKQLSRYKSCKSQKQSSCQTLKWSYKPL